jgi:predicted AAA+ superfamily ATPase
LAPNKKNYVFLDEIQNVWEFQKAADSLYLLKNLDLYITGSNAYMLSGELATLLSGRYVVINMQPLSFREYLSACADQSDLGRKYRDYLINSSFPYALEFKGNRELIRDYLGGLYNTVVLKDIVARKNIADVSMLESVIRFMFANIGNTISVKKISDTMTSDGRKISTHTVENYLSALIDSYILYRVGRYDLKGKQHLKTGEKYYAADMGLRYFLLGSKDADAGRMLENTVFLELIRRGYEVYVGKIFGKEVDFVALKGGETEYYQVAQTVRSENTLKRELFSLDAVNDHNPKYLITLDDDPPASHKGIKQINAIDWLLA